MKHVFLTGFMGAGKTTVGRLLAARLGRPFIDLDVDIERREGMAVPEIFKRRGEDGFREAEHAALEGLVSHEPAVVATGGGVVLRPENRVLLGALGEVVYLAVTPEEALARVGTSGDRPLLADGDVSVARRILDSRLTLYGETAGHVVTTVGRSPAEVADTVARRLSGPATVVVRVEGENARESYDVVIGRGVLDRLGFRLHDLVPHATVAIVSDATAWRLLGGRVAAALDCARVSYRVCEVPAGEASKSWETAGTVLEWLAEGGLDRDSAVVALGGGVVGDLAGFCASVFMRGIPVVQVPTTLLAQVDSSIGGKTGVDLSSGKNLAGSFWPPRVVVTDVETLATLPAAEVTNGLVEAVKGALLCGGESLERMERNIESVVAGDLKAAYVVVRDAAAFKARVVTQDLRESGERQCLNLGHTLGHALEMLAGYGAIPHGLAVAEGMRFAAALAEVLGVAVPGVRERTTALLGRAGAGTSAVWGVLDAGGCPEPSALLGAMKGDKKSRGGIVRFVLLARPGEWRGVDVADDVLLGALERWVRSRGSEA